MYGRLCNTASESACPPQPRKSKGIKLGRKKIFFLCLHRSYEFHNHKNIMTSLFIMNLTKLLKTSILWHSAFFIVQLSHPYMTTKETIVLTIRTFVSKVMPLFFNTLSRFVTAFLSRIISGIKITRQRLLGRFWFLSLEIRQCVLV